MSSVQRDSAEALDVAARLAHGPEPEPAELADHVLGGALQPGARRVASHHRVVGQEGDLRAHVARGDRLGGGVERARGLGEKCGGGGQRERRRSEARRIIPDQGLRRRSSGSPVLRGSALARGSTVVRGSAARRVPRCGSAVVAGRGLSLPVGSRPLGGASDGVATRGAASVGSSSLRRRPSGLPSPSRGRDGTARSGGAIRGVGARGGHGGCGHRPSPADVPAGPSQVVISPLFHRLASAHARHVVSPRIRVAKDEARSGPDGTGDDDVSAPCPSGRGRIAGRRRSRRETGRTPDDRDPTRRTWRRRGSRSRGSADSRSGAPRSTG